MKSSNVLARMRFVALLILIVPVIAACAPSRIGTSWPALSLVTVNDSVRILVAYNTEIDMIDPSNGRLAALTDANGDILFDDQNEARRWMIRGGDYENANFFTAPIVSAGQDGDVLTFPTYDHRLLTFDLDSGQPLLDGVASVKDGIITDGVLANPVVTDDVIYMPYRSRNVVALDRDTLETLWTANTVDGVWASPLLEGNVLYIPSIDHHLYAVDATTGESIWTTDLGGAIASTPLYQDGFLYVGNYLHKMIKIDAATGEVVAEHIGGNWVWGTPSIIDGILYYADLSGRVFALNTSDMTEVWQQHPSDRGIRSTPIVTDQYVIVASRGGVVYWLDRSSGTVIHEREIEGRPEILSDMLIIPSDEATNSPALLVVATINTSHLVAAFSLENSLPVWVYGR